MFNEKHKAENLLKMGFSNTLSLDKSIFLLAKYYKYLNYTEEECNINISNWLQKQILHVSYNKALQKKELKIKLVYERDYRFITDIKIDINLEEMQEIHKLKTKGEKKVAFSFLYLSKLYAQDDGVFYCSYKLLGELSNISDYFIKSKVINVLEDIKFIDIVSRNVLNKVYNTTYKGRDVTKVYKESNRYRVNIVKGKKKILTIGDVECLEEEFAKAYNVCINQYGFDVSVRFQKYIDKMMSEIE